MKQYNFLNSPTIDQVGVEDRISRITARSIKKEAKMQGLLMALSMIDLTTLEGADTEEKVKQLCFKAHHLHDSILGLPTTAAVCVYPNFVKTAVQELKGTNVKVASVATAFPSGQSSAEVKLLDVKMAVDNGAHEVDMVISRGRFHSGDYNFVFDEIAMIKEACGKNVRLKVILETGELVTYDNVRKVMQDLKNIGAHNATQGRNKGLSGKGFLLNLAEQYEQFRTNGKLPATFEVIYGHAWKPAFTRSAGQDFAPIAFVKRK